MRASSRRSSRASGTSSSRLSPVSTPTSCNLTRTAAAQALVDWLATDPTGSGDSDFLIMGDLNSYATEDPIDAARAGADDTLGTADDYTNLIARHQGPFAYSFVFDGQAGYLDHALATPSLADQVLGATEWHINADEPDAIDYDTTFKPPAVDALYEPNAYRSSDHDPVVVFLCADLPGCAADELADAAGDLAAIVAGTPHPKLAAALKKVEDALERLGETPLNRHAAIVKIEVAAGDLEAAMKSGALGASQGTALLEQLSTAARLLVVDAIAEAEARGGDPSKIADAEGALADGDAMRAAGAFKDAVLRYKQALSKAETA